MNTHRSASPTHLATRVMGFLAAIVFAISPALADTGGLQATFNSASSVAVTAGSYTATGTVSFTLNFAPAVGTALTVVNNTGLGFIQGTFSNLAQGQAVALSFGGVTYNFVANYYGGTGNDLVLQWADVTVVAWGQNTVGQLGNNTLTDGLVPAPVLSTGVLAGKTVLALSAGQVSSVALCSDGTLAAWGYNNSGQLGNNTTTQSSVPVAVDMSGALFGKRVVAVATGYEQNLALCSDGTLAAWGYNGDGELGNNSRINSLVPVAVDMTGVLAGKKVVAVAEGVGHSLALCSDGTLAAWGDNSYGQLGTTKVTQSSVPVAVTMTGALAGRHVVAIAAGGDYSLALCSDGSIAAWGYAQQGQLGDNSGSPGVVFVPVAVSKAGVLAGKTVTGIAAGSQRSLAVCSDGTVAAWGNNSLGELGNNSTTDSLVPVAVNTSGALAGKTVIAVAGGTIHSLALCSDGTMAAWGCNVDGELGSNGQGESIDGSTFDDAFDSLVPVTVSTSNLRPGSRFILASTSGAGAAHSLALAAATPGSLLPPPQIVVEQPAATGLTSSASTVDFGSVAIADWALRTFTVKNTGSAAMTISSVTIDGTNGGDFAVTSAAATGMAGGVQTSLTVTFTAGAATSRTAVLHIASNDPVNPVFNINLLGGTTAVPTVALTANFNSASDVPVTASSYTATGNTVNITLSFAPPPTGTSLTVVNNTGLDFIHGTFSNLAQGQAVNLRFAGVTYNFVANYFGGTGNDLVLQWANTQAYAWGANDKGQLGNSTTTDSHVPTPVGISGTLLHKTLLTVAAGGEHNLALCSDGTIAAWGYNHYGQLGDNSTTDNRLPVAVNRSGVLAGKTIVALAGGQYHSLALCSDGTLAAWGRGGMLGNNSTADSSVPVAVDTSGALAGKTVVAMAAGNDHNLALCSDGTLVAWGDNSLGQLGIGSPSNALVLTPVAVNTSGFLNGKTVTAIAAGQDHCLALCSDGTVAAWGYNFYSQLGTVSGPTEVPGAVNMTGVFSGRTVVAIAAGGDHSLAQCADGTLIAWGYDGYGQLGDAGSSNGSLPSVVRVGVLAGKTVTSLAGGADHSLALCSDGTLAAWGYNSMASLATTPPRTAPCQSR